jgi:hypothetical protein
VVVIAWENFLDPGFRRDDGFGEFSGAAFEISRAGLRDPYFAPIVAL